MSLRLEMLQVARLAPNLLGEARNRCVEFLRTQQHPEGGFTNRAGEVDLYYTVFGLDCLTALQESPTDAAAEYAFSFGEGEGLDFVHLCCLARCRAALGLSNGTRLLEQIAAHRSADGGYAPEPGAANGTAYAAFLALGAHQDLNRPLDDPRGLLASLENVRAADGGYANAAGADAGLTPPTAAVVLLRRHLGAPPEPHLGLWLLDRCRPDGGFYAAPQAPVPDLLSTATALHALASLGHDLDCVAEPCLDFLDTLWSSEGGFYGTWADTTLDCEYLFYGLLTLGHLSLTQR
jgi:prenyltransferase beta subunit